MTIRFARPSPRRVLGSILTVALLICVLSGLALYLWALLGYSEDQHPSIGEYARLFVVLVAISRPAVVVNLWWISAPVILVVAAIVAVLHRGPVAETDSDAGCFGDHDDP